MATEETFRLWGELPQL